MSAAQVWDNIIAYTLQISLLVCLGAFVQAVLRVRMPSARLLFWQAILVACLALPVMRPWRQEVVDGTIQVTTLVTAIAAAPAPTPLLAAERTLRFREIALWLLGAGIAIRLALLGVGLARLAAYRRRGSEMPPETRVPFTRSGVSLLLSDDVPGPVTFGWLRPVVLLPSRFLSLGPEMREAILRHELTHVNRRDWLFTIGEELVRAVLWFHPAVWWVISEIQLAREQTVDRLVIETTGAPGPYLDALLMMAGIPASGSPAQMDLAPAPMFLRRRHLKRRLMEAMQEVRMATISKTRLVCVMGASMVMVAAACWLATGAFPLSAAPQVVTDAPGISVNLNGSRLIHRSPVAWPPVALARGVEGTIIMQLRLDANGAVGDAIVLSGPDDLRNAVQQSVVTWHFDKSMASTVQVVNIDFSKPAAMNPQPAEKVLFDQALDHIGHGNYEAARLTLNTLLNTYPASVVLPQAKLAIIDSWLREGGAHSLAQAEAEYRDFILFYPNMRQAAELQFGSRLRQLQPQAQTTVKFVAPPPPPPPPPPASGRVSRIVVMGLTNSARDTLLSRLPIREGGEWSPQMFDAVRAAAKEFDSHLVTSLERTGSGELELRIAAGLTPQTGTVTLRVARSGAATAQPTIVPADPATGLYRVGNGVSAPAVLYRLDPVFPEDAGADKTDGTVLLSCVVGASGKVEEIRVVKSIDTAFDSKAVEALSKWVFRPGMSNGVPVKVRAQVEINFRR